MASVWNKEKVDTIYSIGGTDMYKELLDKARELCIEESRKYEEDNDTHLRESGFVLEDRHHKLYPKLKRLSSRGKKGDWDFIHENGILIDVKGCWAKKYGNNIFIEKIANIRKNTTPCFLKPEYKDKNRWLWYVDYENGNEYIFDMKKLLPELRYYQTTLGGYNKNVLGWKVPVSFAHKTIEREV